MILLLVLLPQPRVTARQLDLAPADVRLLDLRGRFERVAGGDDERCVLAGLERTDAISDAEDLRGVERDRLERVVLREPERRCHARLVRQVARVRGRARAGDAEA